MEEEYYDKIIQICKQNKYLSTPKNNKLLVEFLQAKIKGGYGRIIFDKDIGKKRAIIKAINLRKVDDHFQKDFDKLTEDDLLKYRDLLNKDEIYCKKVKVKWNKTKERTALSGSEIEQSKTPISYRTKQDLVKNFKEFWKFLTEYHHQNKKKELTDITRYLKIKKPDDFKEVNPTCMSEEEVHKLLGGIKNEDFKALVQLSLMSGARPCEILRVKLGSNLYKNNKGKWVIHLPKVKRVSYTKHPFEIDMYEESIYPYFEKLKESKKQGDYVFSTTDATFRKLMKYYTFKYLGVAYSPKILRKTARMLRTNAGYQEMWINKLLGHSPNSNVQAYYTNYAGIENDTLANEKLKEKQYPGLKQDYDNLKLKQKAQEEKLAELKELVTRMAANEIRSR